MMPFLADFRRTIDPDVDPDEGDQDDEDEEDEDEDGDEDDEDDENGEKWYLRPCRPVHGTERPALDFRVRTSYTGRVFQAQRLVLCRRAWHRRGFAFFLGGLIPSVM